MILTDYEFWNWEKWRYQLTFFIFWASHIYICKYLLYMKHIQMRNIINPEIRYSQALFHGKIQATRRKIRFSVK